MTSLKAHLFLHSLSKQYQAKVKRISRKEISLKIAQMKILASEKKISPKLLQLQIAHLEEQLESVYEVDKAILKLKREESSKIKALRKESEQLKKRLLTGSQPEIHQRVDKLSFLLANQMAQREIDVDVKLHHSNSKRSKLEESKLILKERIHTTKDYVDPEVLRKIRHLEAHYQRLKGLLKSSDDSNTQTKYLMVKLELVERRLDKYLEQYPQALSQENSDEGEVTESIISIPQLHEVKHTLLFAKKEHTDPPMKRAIIDSIEQEPILDNYPMDTGESNGITDAQLEAELPMPPPPRMTN